MNSPKEVKQINLNVESIMQSVNTTQNQLIFISVLALTFCCAFQIIPLGSLILLLIRLKWFKKKQLPANAQTSERV